MLSLVLVACVVQGTSAAAQPSLVERGRALVLSNCASCHAVGQRDESANPAAPRFRELSRRYPVENLGEALGEGILTGHPAMPEFAFPASDVAAIIAYLKSIQVRQGAGLPPPPAS